MLTKRQFLFGGVVLLGTGMAGTFSLPASANEATLLSDILHGVSDALVREYIREHYRDGARWDGRVWIVDNRRYSPAEYRVYLEDRYRRAPHPEPQGHPEHPKHPHGMPPGQAKKYRHDDHDDHGHGHGH